jgi:hypothetical protein
MEIAANLLRLSNEWIVAQVDEVDGETLPGDPDCVLRQLGQLSIHYSVAVDSLLSPSSFTS